MDSEQDAIEVVNNQAAGQFEIRVDGRLALLAYRVHGESILFSHTEVPRAIGGRGLAATLTEHALAYAKTNGLAVMPVCPYVAQYIRDHTAEYAALVPANLHRSYGISA